MNPESTTGQPVPSRSAPRNKWWFFPRLPAWLVLGIALAASAGAWFLAWKHAELEARKRFDEEAGRITAALSERIQIYEDVLHGAVGLYAASYTVERNEWRAYLQSVSIEKRFPGVDGVGFIAYVERNKLDEFLTVTRSDKTPDFAVREPGTNDDLLIVKYIEPEERHRAMVGWNMGVDAERRAVAQRARDTGRAALTGIITLREDRRTPQTGCMMLLPVYRHGAATDTVAGRQAGLEGWVFARFITSQLMQSVLGNKSLDLHLRILDADAAGPDNLIFDEDPALSASRPEGEAWFSSAIPIGFGGRRWTLSFTTKPSFKSATRRGSSLWVGAGGGLISLLLFGIAWSLSHTRERALAIAADMTGTLRETNERLHLEIRERQRSEEAVRLAKEAAEEANRAKSQFLASMSHELRTPLNSVIGFANILLKNKAGALAPAELNFLERIKANGTHLLALINEILDLSKIEARKVDLQLSQVALDALVRETIAQQEGLLRDKPVRLLADLPEQMAPLAADADKLRQVLINLLGNALKFTEQGSVTVRAITDAGDHRPIRLEVIDTGIGIPKDKLGVIFEAFQQAEAGTTRKYGGTGLGLTISQALCQLMGYHITVASEPGRGSTFSVHLTPGQPAPPPAPPAPPPATEPEPPPADLRPLGRKLVLVIDDELDSRTLLTHAMEEFGCQTITANSGEQGLRIAREFRPHLITVDLMMPELDGWEVIRALKADPALADIPVVIVSIVAGENRGRMLGAVDVLQKPVGRAEMLAVLRRCLTSAHPRILIVDDDEDSRRVLAAYLEDEACEFCTAANGQEALESMEKSPPDLVLLDLMMPVMDGISFLNHVRATPRFQFLPVVVVTAKQLTPSETEWLRHTALDIVKKGGSFEADLKRVLRRFLQAGATESPRPVP